MDTKNLTNISTHERVPLFGLGTTPQADWKIIFFSTLLFAVGASIFNVYTFLSLGRNGVEVGDNAAEQGVDLDKLQVANLYYENKEKEFQTIVKTPGASAIDPSI